MKLYRVIACDTWSRQPCDSDTYWKERILYVGPDRDEARIEFHRSHAKDFERGHGSQARKTVVDVIEDAGTDDFSDDEDPMQHLGGDPMKTAIAIAIAFASICHAIGYLTGG